MDVNYDGIIFILSCLILRRDRLANFADIIKIATIFLLMQPLETRKNLTLCIKMQSLSVFLNKGKVVDFWQNMLTSAELKGCVM